MNQTSYNRMKRNCVRQLISWITPTEEVPTKDEVKEWERGWSIRLNIKSTWIL